MDIVIKKPNEEELNEVKNWPIWEKEESNFDWYYSDQEKCYFLEGEVEIEMPDASKVKIEKGDMVIFPQGLDCKWHIYKKVKKHYKFG
ncbi:MAG: cupin domain-containing protein [Candidatus Omnitrophica bacterium]|nr:cupin domain-containing protein [Candidatus Omnitrophota bacterium]